MERAGKDPALFFCWPDGDVLLSRTTVYAARRPTVSVLLDRWVEILRLAQDDTAGQGLSTN